MASALDREKLWKLIQTLVESQDTLDTHQEYLNDLFGEDITADTMTDEEAALAQGHFQRMDEARKAAHEAVYAAFNAYPDFETQCRDMLDLYFLKQTNRELQQQRETTPTS